LHSHLILCTILPDGNNNKGVSMTIYTGTIAGRSSEEEIRCDEEIKRALENEDEFMRLFSHPSLLEDAVKKCPKHKERLRAFFLSSPKIFMHLISNLQVLKQYMDIFLTDYGESLKVFFPDNQQSLTQLVSNTFGPIECVNALFFKHKERTMQLVLTNPTILMRLISNCSELKQCVKFFPEYEERIIQLVLNNPTILMHLIKSIYGLKQFVEYFPVYIGQIMDVVLNNPEIFRHILNNGIISDNNRLQQALRSFPEYQEIFSQPTVEAAWTKAQQYVKEHQLKNYAKAVISAQEKILLTLTIREKGNAANPDKKAAPKIGLSSLPLDLVYAIFTQLKLFNSKTKFFTETKFSTKTDNREIIFSTKMYQRATLFANNDRKIPLLLKQLTSDPSDIIYEQPKDMSFLDAYTIPDAAEIQEPSEDKAFVLA